MLPVYFDFDGTLVDTLPGLVDSVNHLRAAYGHEPADVEMVQSWIGGGLDVLLESALSIPAAGIAERDAFLNHYTGEPLLAALPYDGIDALLESLGPIRTAIVTNKNAHSVRKLLHRLQWHNRFGAVVCPENGLRKPDRAFMLRAAKELGVAPDTGVMVGDSEFDVEAAKAAGLISVAVSWGFRDVAILEQSSPDYLVDNVAALAKLLQSLNQEHSMP